MLSSFLGSTSSHYWYTAPQVHDEAANHMSSNARMHFSWSPLLEHWDLAPQAAPNLFASFGDCVHIHIVFFAASQPQSSKSSLRLATAWIDGLAIMSQQSPQFAPRNAPQPIVSNVLLLQGVGPDSLGNEIAQRLGRKYLGDAKKYASSALGQYFEFGVVYGEQRRMMLPLVVEPTHDRRTPCVVFFLIDTGAPASFFQKRYAVRLALDASTNS